MEYGQVVRAEFLERKNRFIGTVLLNGQETVCHIKNTGRCRELLIKGVPVYLERAENPNRKTAYDLIAVYKGERLINIDSQAPNRAAAEFLPQMFPKGTLRAETVFGDSRFDFCVTLPDRTAYVEVKGVTLEEDGVVRFPDAPTERGIKHLRGLVNCVRQGYEAYVLFVVQMKNVLYFTPNDQTHAAFGTALREAAEAGVRILAVDCTVTPESMTVADFVEVRLSDDIGK